MTFDPFLRWATNGPLGPLVELFCVIFCIRAILSWCPSTWHVYIVYNIFSLNISSIYSISNGLFLWFKHRQHVSITIYSITFRQHLDIPAASIYLTQTHSKTVLSDRKCIKRHANTIVYVCTYTRNIKIGFYNWGNRPNVRLELLTAKLWNWMFFVHC